ncbi:response regulator [Kribbella deserti]|uniref:Transcriptional regulatory protein n=1 Tax=Kribbella deserti TaxID=1926257 RepID=A0ABV6QEL2_9ACTN
MIEVLIVDDDFHVARIHSGFVGNVPGFEVVGVAHTGADALAQVEALAPDLVLLDLYLPDMFGLEVVTQLRAAGHDCDVLVITASREAEAVRAAVRHGVVNYLLKPFSFDDLRVRLDTYAAQRRELPEESVTGQADIDRVLNRGTTPATATRLPKGLGQETATLVERALRETETTLSAAECAERVGISRVSARRYLEHFCKTGQADVSLRYGTTGRPERRYRWT